MNESSGRTGAVQSGTNVVARVRPIVSNSAIRRWRLCSALGLTVVEADRTLPRMSTKAGRVCLWRYRDKSRDYAGFHLSADRAGCDQLLSLLPTLIKPRTAQIGTVVLDPVTPTDLAIPRSRVGQVAVMAYGRWELLVDSRFEPEHLKFVVVADRIRTELSHVQAESLIGGVEDIRARRGDYSIGDEEGDQLWFWWQDDPSA